MNSMKAIELSLGICGVKLMCHEVNRVHKLFLVKTFRAIQSVRNKYIVGLDNYSRRRSTVVERWSWPANFPCPAPDC